MSRRALVDLVNEVLAAVTGAAVAGAAVAGAVVAGAVAAGAGKKRLRQEMWHECTLT